MKNRELNLANYLISEEYENNVIKIYYEDLDLDMRTDILKAIAKDNKHINIDDDITRHRLIEKLQSKPLLVATGTELLNGINADF